VGRLDQQVKIRGYRLELGEIEAVLGEHGGVKESVVVAREGAAGEKRLVAYVVPHDERRTKGEGRVPAERRAGARGAEAKGEPETERTAEPLSPSAFRLSPSHELRRFLKEKLPEYLVPSAFVLLEALPLTPNGKVDRRALPEPDGARMEPSSAFVAPRTPLEEQVAAIWREVLGLPRVGVEDDFFALGGHSLLATQVVSRIRRALQVELPLRHFFAAPTVAGMALIVAQQRAGMLRQEELDRWLTDLDCLSDREASSLVEARQRPDPARAR
jgi:acyl carrier protein